MTPRTKSIAQNHFNCDTLPGARLADNPEFFRGAHWHEQHYFHRLMSPVVSSSSENGLTLRTLAMLEDSGWYRVDYRGAVQPSFGIGAGCECVHEDCIIEQDQVLPEWVKNEFCSIPIERQGSALTRQSLNNVFCVLRPTKALHPFM